MAAVGTQSAGDKAGLQTKASCNAKYKPEEDDALKCPRDFDASLGHAGSVFRYAQIAGVKAPEGVSFHGRGGHRRLMADP